MNHPVHLIGTERSIRYLYLSILTITVLCMVFTLPVFADEPPVGFVLHYPNYSEGIDVLPNTGATSLIVQSGSSMLASNPAEGVFDFTLLDKEIDYCDKNNMKMVILIEANPLFVQPWLADKVKAAGQSQRSHAGVDFKEPSISSTVFKKYQEVFIRKTIDHVKQTDKNRVITHIQVGAEWWFPSESRYNPSDIALFRKWLGKQYGSIDKLNKVWKSNYKSFDVVQAPKIDYDYSTTMKSQSIILTADTGAVNCSWSTASAIDSKIVPGKMTFPAVTPGKTYTFTALVKGSNLTGVGGFLELGWVKSSGGAPLSAEHSEAVYGNTGWEKLTVTAKAPKDAERAWLLLKVAGTGTAVFDDVVFKEAGTNVNLAPYPDLASGGKQPSAWSFQNWTGKGKVKAEWLRNGGVKNSPCVRVVVTPDDQAGYKNKDAAVRDWSNYWYEAGAEYINSLARFAKECDPSRKTITYLTFSFAYPAEWDYSQQYAIAPDEVAIRGKDIDVHSMQLAAADGDPYRVTACLDIVRKYGKPISAVDLQDFTSGVHIGYEKMDKITQSTIQHGAEGFFYYCWHGLVPPYDFYPNMKVEDMNAMLTDAREARKLVQDLSIKPKIALVQPILPAGPGDQNGYKNDYRSYIGWYKILQGMHQTFDVITLNELNKGAVNLDQYEWIMIPDCAYIPNSALYRLKLYANGKGRIVTSGRFAAYDDAGTKIGAIKPISSLSLPDYGKEYTSVIERRAGGNTPALFIWRKDTPQTRKAFENAKIKIRGFFRTEGIAQDIEILPDDPSISAVVYDGDGERAVYLVNMGDKSAKNVRVRVRSDAGSDVKVYADTRLTECGSKNTDGWTDVTLPEFRTGCIIRIGKSK
ncbi:MAG: beta-galactosidase [Armatimonadota bacterium]